MYAALRPDYENMFDHSYDALLRAEVPRYSANKVSARTLSHCHSSIALKANTSTAAATDGGFAAALRVWQAQLAERRERQRSALDMSAFALTPRDALAHSVPEASGPFALI